MLIILYLDSNRDIKSEDYYPERERTRNVETPHIYLLYIVYKCFQIIFSETQYSEFLILFCVTIFWSEVFGSKFWLD